VRQVYKHLDLSNNKKHRLNKIFILLFLIFEEKVGKILIDVLDVKSRKKLGSEVVEGSLFTDTSQQFC
jgi:hypothetical protein